MTLLPLGTSERGGVQVAIRDALLARVRVQPLALTNFGPVTSIRLERSMSGISVFE